MLMKEVEDLVMYSVFTNNVEEPILDETTFLPETNVFMLYLSIFKVLGVTRSSKNRKNARIPLRQR